MKTLREWRQERMLSTRDLAKTAGISDKTLIHVELCRQRPQGRTMRAWCTAFGVTPRDVAEFAAVLEGEEAAAA